MPSCHPGLLAGTVLEGGWLNRTPEYLAKQRGETRRPQDFEEPETPPARSEDRATELVGNPFAEVPIWGTAYWEVP